MWKHKPFPIDEFYKTFGVKQKQINHPKHGKTEFRYYEKCSGKLEPLQILWETYWKTRTTPRFWAQRFTVIENPC